MIYSVISSPKYVIQTYMYFTKKTVRFFTINFSSNSYYQRYKNTLADKVKKV
jgi:hypothetical protein